MPWAKRNRRSIPSVSARQVTVEANDYSAGMDSFLSNDKFSINNGGTNTWRLAQDARIVTLGEYETRQGFDFHSDAAGETKDANQESTSGAADQSFSETTWLAQTFTTAAAGRLTKLNVRLKNASSATGTIVVDLYTNNSGSPGTFVSRSTIASSSVTSSYAYLSARFPDAPQLSNTTVYWIVVRIQTVGSGSYSWSSTTSATTAKVSTDSGTSWSSTSYALNFQQYYATDSAPKGGDRLYKSDGTSVSFIAHGTVLYSVNDVTGALTSVKTGLNTLATDYEFATVNDITYYVNGYDGYRKLSGTSFSTDAQVNSTNYTHICSHKGLIFLVSKDDPNKLVFSNFGEYETFTSTDFIYVPSPKTGDPITALVSLNGYLLIFTRDNKYILSGDDNATFTLDEAPDQKGTYSQRTVTADKNYVYYLSNDGVYRSNGSEATLISRSNYDDILRLSTKENCAVGISKGRLYLWYSEPGQSFNSKCWVYNLNISSGKHVLESCDTGAYVNRAIRAFNDDDEMLVLSSLVGQIHWQELSTNDYCNLGAPLEYILQTPYMTFGSPAVEKQIRYWEPRFGAQDGNYTISLQYAYDLRDNWTTYSSSNVQGSGPVWGSVTWGSFTWGRTSELQSQLYVPGEHRRIALRYYHYAARQPHRFLGHSLVAQTRRMR